MVSFKTICLLGAALLGSVQAIPAVPIANTVQLRGESGTRVVENPDLDVGSVEPFETSSDGLAKRNKPVMRLWWSPKGAFVFMTGINFPRGVLDHLTGMPIEAPPAIIYETINEFFKPTAASARTHQRAAFLFRQASHKGGMYGYGPAQGDMGFALTLNNFPSADDVQAVLKAIQAWAESTGGVLQVLMKPNDFFNLPTQLLQNSKRLVQRESAKCPKLDNIMQYANKDVPANLDFKLLRYAGHC